MLFKKFKMIKESCFLSSIFLNKTLFVLIVLIFCWDLT